MVEPLWGTLSVNTLFLLVDAVATPTWSAEGTANESEQGFRGFDRPRAESGFPLVVTPTLRVCYPQRRQKPCKRCRASHLSGAAGWSRTAATRIFRNLSNDLSLQRRGILLSY